MYSPSCVFLLCHHFFTLYVYFPISASTILLSAWKQWSSYSVLWPPGSRSAALPSCCCRRKRTSWTWQRGGRCWSATSGWRPELRTALSAAATRPAPCGWSGRRRSKASGGGRSSPSPTWRRRAAPSGSRTSSEAGSCRTPSSSSWRPPPSLRFAHTSSAASRGRRRKTRSWL